MLKIDEMYAFIASDEGGEGLIAYFHAGQWMPMVGADMARVEALRPIAQKICDETGKPVRLLRFSVRENLEVLTPLGEAITIQATNATEQV